MKFVFARGIFSKKMEFVILIKVQLFHTSFHIMVDKIILYMYKKTPQTFGRGEFKTFISRQ